MWKFLLRLKQIMEEVVGLWRKLSITEEEAKVILIDDEDHQIKEEDRVRYLVARVLT